MHNFFIININFTYAYILFLFIICIYFNFNKSTKYFEFVFVFGLIGEFYLDLNLYYTCIFSILDSVPVFAECILYII